MRPTVLTVARFALAAGCGGAADRATTRPAPSPTGAPAAPIGTLANPTAAPATTAAPGTRVAAAIDLAQALLTLQDLPAGWTAWRPSRTSGRERICDVTPFAVPSVATAEAEFEKNVYSRVFHTVTRYAPGEGKRVMDSAIEASERCREWTAVGPYANVTVRLTRLAFPNLGDQTLALRTHAKAEITSGQADAIYIRRRDIIAFVGYLVTGPAEAQVDAELSEKLARRADEKLATVAK